MGTEAYKPEIEGTDYQVKPRSVQYSSMDLVSSFETIGKILGSFIQDKPEVPETITTAEGKVDKLPSTLPEEMSEPTLEEQREAVGDWVTPEIAAFLNTIAEAEGTNASNSYKIIVGLGKGGQNAPAYLTDYGQHPNIVGMITSHGPSTAAGRYQIVYKTWKGLVEQNPELKDFSPDNQDKAAWILAKSDYKKKLGRDLEQDLKAGYTEGLTALKTTWTSFYKKDPEALYKKYRGTGNATDK
jgi:muramidase (phage lysozyme)